MLINYCDLCGTPLKDSNFYSLYLNNPNNSPPDSSKFDNITDYYHAYNQYLMALQKEVKEICPSCKHLFNKIFEYRLEGMARLTEDCMDLFNLPTRKNPKERDNGKDKKN